MVLAMNNVKLPVGISDFHKLRQNEYYYVDKTNLIKELLESRIAEVIDHETKTLWKDDRHEYVGVFL